MSKKTGCCLYGVPLAHKKTFFSIECSMCGTKNITRVVCENGHFVCDACHSMEANEWIEKMCIQSDETNPLLLANTLMKHPNVKIYGSEHHFIVPAVMICTFYNRKGLGHLKETRIKLAHQRAEKVPGCDCGFCYSCGAAVGSGIFVSIVLEATPLSIEHWSLCNRMTAQCLELIADLGGPRCCKRDTFLAIQEAAHFSDNHLDCTYGEMEIPTCTFFHLNSECWKQECLFYNEMVASF